MTLRILIRLKLLKRELQKRKILITVILITVILIRVIINIFQAHNGINYKLLELLTKLLED